MKSFICIACGKTRREGPYLIIHLDDALGIFPRQDILVTLKLLHGFLNPLKEVARPCNVTSNWREVARNRRIMLLFLIQLLDLWS